MSETWFKLEVTCAHCLFSVTRQIPKNHIPRCPNCGKPMAKCEHEWHADQDNDCNVCIKCGARQEIYVNGN